MFISILFKLYRFQVYQNILYPGFLQANIPLLIFKFYLSFTDL